MMACSHPKHHEPTLDVMPHHFLPMKIEDEMKDVCYRCFAQFERGHPEAPKKVDSLSFFRS